jgi:hypothetical protein
MEGVGGGSTLKIRPLESNSGKGLSPNRRAREDLLCAPLLPGVALVFMEPAATILERAGDPPLGRWSPLQGDGDGYRGTAPLQTCMGPLPFLGLGIGWTLLCGTHHYPSPTPGCTTATFHEWCGEGYTKSYCRCPELPPDRYPEWRVLVESVRGSP